ERDDDERPVRQPQAGQEPRYGPHRRHGRAGNGARRSADRGSAETRSLQRTRSVDPMTYTAQELNRKITFQQVTFTQDPVTGEQTATWPESVCVCARVEPLVGREYLGPAPIQAADTTAFTRRDRDDITTPTRIVFGGKSHNTKSIQNTRSANRG